LLSDPDVRAEAAGVLGKIGSSEHDVVNILVSLLIDPNGVVRWEAASALGAIGSPARAAVPGLLQTLKDSGDWAYKWRVAKALGQIGDQRAIGPLIGALSDSNDMVRSTAATALGEIGSSEAIPALLERSFDNDPGVRCAVIEALADLAQERNDDIVNRLINMLLGDDNAGARRVAARSLATIGSLVATEAIKRALHDEGELVRAEARSALDSAGHAT
jgi:HEAT repeat protein